MDILKEKIKASILKFDWSDFGMDSVAFDLQNDLEGQEWVDALATKIVNGLTDTVQDPMTIEHPQIARCYAKAMCQGGHTVADHVKRMGPS